MKKIIPLLLIIFLPFITLAQKTYSTYKEAMEDGQKLNDGQKYEGALLAYQQAQKLGATAVEKAEAVFKEAKATSRMPVEGQRKEDVKAKQRKRAEDEKRLLTSITVLLGISDDIKARAYEALIDFYTEDEFTSSYSKDGLKKDLYTQLVGLKNLSPEIRIKYLLRRQTSDDLKEVVASKTATDDEKAKAIFYMENQTYGDANKAKKIEEILSLTAASTENKVQAIKKCVELYNKASKLEDATRVLKKINELPEVKSADRAYAYDILGRIELNNKNPKAAEEYFNKIYDLKDLTIEEKANARINTGEQYKIYKSYDNAVKEFEKAIGMRNVSDDIKAKAHYNIGLIYYEQLNYPDARKAWKKIEDLKPDSSITIYKTTALQYIGTSYYKEKNYKDAAKAFDDMAAVKDITPLLEGGATYMQGQCLLAAKDYKGARKAYTKTMEKEGASVLSKMQAGVDIITTYEEEEKWEDAAEAQKPLFAIYNLNPYDKAIPTADQRSFADLRTKFNNEFWDKAKTWGEKPDRYKAAIKLLETRLAVDDKLFSTGTKRIHHNMGIIYAANGKKDLAKRNFQAVIDVDKNSTDFYKKDSEKRLAEL